MKTDDDPFSTLQHEAEFRRRMAEIGHPVIGPQSLYKLTKPELRIYAEGFYVENERKRRAREKSESDGTTPAGHAERKRERDDALLEQMDAKAKEEGLVPAES